MEKEKLDISAEVERIQRIPVIKTLLDVICEVSGLGFAFIARVTKDQWIACAVQDNINFGVKPGGELILETTICHEIENHREAVVINHASTDPEYCNHPTPTAYGFESYISVPIILTDSTFYGTLCALDPRPAELKTPKIIGMFTLFADLVSQHLSTLNRLTETEENLLIEKKNVELRDQFMAILGHDLRNPVGAVRNSAQLLMRMPLDDRALRLATIIQDSTYRMTGLIENILDFARGTLGDGLTISRNNTSDLEKVLFQVINELRIIWPDKIINTQFELNADVFCDPMRIAQLFSNILGNALSHGSSEFPVKVKASSDSGEFKLNVCNKGPEIPNEILARLFLPFSRGTGEGNKEGLGLGLYISYEIAKAHEGSLTVTSAEGETCFICVIPSS